MLAAGDETGEVRHVDHQVGADLVGDGAEVGELELARIGGAAGDDDARAMLDGELIDLVHVDAVRVGTHHVRHRLEPLARLVDGRAVRQMSAGGEAEAEDRVARRGERVEHALVGLAARVRLHVGEAAAEQLLGAVDGELLDDVDVLAAAVVAPAGIAFGVLVGQHAAGRFQHGLGDDVLRRDQLDLMLLAAKLLADRIGDLRIAVGNAGGEKSALGDGLGLRVKHRSLSLLSRQMNGLNSSARGSL